MAAQWRRERPDLELDTLFVFGGVRHVADRFDDVMRPALAAAGVGAGEFDVLALLRLAGLPYALTSRQICDRTHVTAGAITNRVDRLVARGHVVKSTALRDARGRVVQLTDSGLELVDSVMAAKLAIGREVLATLSEEELAAFAALLARVGAAIEERAQPHAPA